METTVSRCGSETELECINTDGGQKAQLGIHGAFYEQEMSLYAQNQTYPRRKTY